ncbi:MAG: C39 family peptidase [Hyphomonadaceae bacterium]|nr:C39 family peptidase [Hyphomonadaceae bacterium]MCA8887178.1 C39 family peptidase [Hyphomonadaceae bacterium]
MLSMALAASCFSAPAAAQVRTHGEGGGSFTVSVTSWRDIPFRTVVRQQYDYSCGSAAVATLLRFHYGLQVNEGEVFQSMYDRGDQARIRSVGFSMLDMRSYLEARGFRADGLRLSLDRLASLNIPTIALISHDGYRHFVVVKGISADRVLVGDPTFGLQTYTREEFAEVWNGVVLAVRQAPPHWPEPAYNRAEEWRPWSRAPLDMAQQPISATDLTLGYRELYQITPITPPVPGS